MKKKFAILIFVLTIANLSAQNKYIVYFTDKGIDYNSLSKSSTLIKTAEQLLSPRAIERRKNSMGGNFIQFEDMPLNENYIDELIKRGILIAHRLKWFNAVSCYIEDENILEIQNLRFVKKIEPVNKIVNRGNLPVDMQMNESQSVFYKSVSYDYGKSLTQNMMSEIPAIHDLGINGNGVMIGILDTGFRWKNHPALQNQKVLAEYDFINNDSNTANEAGDQWNQDDHGTSVFSIIGGFAPANLIGPAFGASYLLAKTEFVPTETNAEEDNYAAALEWMENYGVDITTSSLGYRKFDAGQKTYSYEDMDGKTSIVAKAANLAFERGVSTFTAAGNEGMDLISSPGDAFNIITVGSVNSSKIISGFSSRGPTSDGRIKPEIVAMGEMIYHAKAGTNSYVFGNGTSYATPIAAGIAGLLKSAFPHLTNKQIRKIFLESGDNTLSPNNEIGYGLISAKKVLSFPNLKNEENNYILHKLFTDERGFVPSTVKINFLVNDDDLISVGMSETSNHIFNYNFPNFISGSKIKFYFTYSTTTGDNVREPSGNDYYHFVYGSSLISLYTEDTDQPDIPEIFLLKQNFPNPFNSFTNIEYEIAPVNNSGINEKINVAIKIYDILGRFICTVLNEEKLPGKYSVRFQPDFIGYGLPSGVYFYSINVAGFSNTKKMVYIK